VAEHLVEVERDRLLTPDTAGSWRYLPRSMCSNAPTHADWSVDRTARRSGLRSAAVGASLILPFTSRPADQPIRARESMSVLRWCRRCGKPRPWWRRRRAPHHRAELLGVDCGGTAGSTAAARSRSVLVMSAYAIKMGCSLVPADFEGDAVEQLSGADDAGHPKRLRSENRACCRSRCSRPGRPPRKAEILCRPDRAEPRSDARGALNQNRAGLIGPSDHLRIVAIPGGVATF
jgi:hypothetical protein